MLHFSKFSTTKPDFRRELLETVFIYLNNEMLKLYNNYDEEQLDLTPLKVLFEHCFKYLGSDDFIHPKLFTIFLKHFIVKADNIDPFLTNMRAAIFADITEAFRYMLDIIKLNIGSQIFTIPDLVMEKKAEIINLSLIKLENNGVFPISTKLEEWIKNDPTIMATGQDLKKRMKGDFYAEYEYSSIYYEDIQDLTDKLYILLFEIYLHNIKTSENFTKFTEQDFELIMLFLTDAKLKPLTDSADATAQQSIMLIRELIITNFEALTIQYNFQSDLKPNNNHEPRLRKIVQIAANYFINTQLSQYQQIRYSRRMSLDF